MKQQQQAEVLKLPATNGDTYLHGKIKAMKPLFCAGILLFLSICSRATTPPDLTGKDSTGDNTLTAKEKADGWQLLFDGKTMRGWRTYQNKPQNSWLVKDGILVCRFDTTQQYQHADLMTEKEFTNFELALDWKIEPRGNSGILYMVNETYEYPFQSGPEYQLLDDPFYLTDPEEHIHASQKSGSNYDMADPLAEALKPAGEWNHTIIKVDGKHVEHWLNGKKMADYTIDSDAWKREKAKSKWKDAEGYAANQTGHIDLQDHGGGVSLKNIKIKAL